PICVSPPFRLNFRPFTRVGLWGRGPVWISTGCAGCTTGHSGVGLSYVNLCHEPVSASRMLSAYSRAPGPLAGGRALAFLWRRIVASLVSSSAARATLSNAAPSLLSLCSMASQMTQPICIRAAPLSLTTGVRRAVYPTWWNRPGSGSRPCAGLERSEEHTSELQSRENLVCRLLLEKKKEFITQITKILLI